MQEREERSKHDVDDCKLYSWGYCSYGNRIFYSRNNYYNITIVHMAILDREE